MGGLPEDLAAGLRDRLGLCRGVETGTLHGGGARLLAQLFDQAVSIELSEELHAGATRNLADVPNVELLRGDSRELLGGVVDVGVPTLFFLDGHWSGGPTAGEQAECPVLEEIAALAAGHPDDCVVVDDARLFEAPPPPPHDPAQWPTLAEVVDALQAAHPGHYVTVQRDAVIAVPAAARDVVDQRARRGLLARLKR